LNSLLEIANQIDPEIRSDKSEDYLNFYESLFASVHLEPLNIVEVGVYKGGSLLMFAEYFPNARILGIDRNEPTTRFHELAKARSLGDRVKTEQGSQSDINFLQRAINAHFGSSQIDLVIDDASHFYHHTKVTFDYLFPNYLKSGGHYIIEDWGCGYWPKWPDGNANGRNGLPRLVKELIDLTALADRTRLFRGRRSLRVKEEQPSPIKKMIIVPGVAALIKV